ncbi:S-adenosylmethionine:tRNA ribosyltransferase-isomerase, partial [Staphylococcus aureus]|nr:S-adenosylmethionine:tRNA ribosyltransferase-isomerase [Staphylococcus aureus]
MDIEAFDYHLPESLIAQTPLKNRDESRLLILGRQSGNIEHQHFKDVIDYLESGDTLVLNDTRVMPARLFGLKEET